MKNDGVLYHQVLLYSPESKLLQYNLFAKVEEPLQGTWCNTRDELIHAIGQSKQNISKDGHANGVRHLQNIWQKVINKEGDYKKDT